MPPLSDHHASEIDPPRAPYRAQARAELPTPFATFTLSVYTDDDDKEHLAITLGDVAERREPAPLLRIHSECLTGDALFSLRCDCGFQLEHALQRIAVEGRGALLYLRQEGRGIGLANKIRAYALQDQGADTVEANEQLGFAADHRQYHTALEMLRALGVRRVRLLTNNPRKINALEEGGIEICERLPLSGYANPYNTAYLSTKARKLGHLFEQGE